MWLSLLAESGVATSSCLRQVWQLVQANVNPTLSPKEWNLEALSDKMKQYCYLLDDLTADMLSQEANADYEALRDYLRERAVDAYWEKVQQIAHSVSSMSKSILCCLITER